MIIILFCSLTSSSKLTEYKNLTSVYDFVISIYDRKVS